MDATEEDRRNIDSFFRIIDSKAGPTDKEKCGTILKIIDSTVETVPKYRPRMSVVSMHNFSRTSIQLIDCNDASFYIGCLPHFCRCLKCFRIYVCEQLTMNSAMLKHWL